MIIKSLELTDYRNYEDLKIEFDKPIDVSNLDVDEANDLLP